MNAMIYLNLFWSFFQVGLFSFGGGYAALPLIQHQVVDIHGWLTLTEFSGLVAVSQMTPGPIAINSATFVGTQVGGLGGAVVATLGCITPSCIIISLLAWIYARYQEVAAIRGMLAGLRPTVTALIFAAGLSILGLAFWGEKGFQSELSALDPVAVILFVAGLFALRKFRTNPMYVMLGSGIIGGAWYFWM